ncbi:MAG TPA: methyltransferase domain-containing protein, partial [Chloroflexota bacterium]|nr:methyltransferase domain-containing protein [Chloroflexota bacterium]
MLYRVAEALTRPSQAVAYARSRVVESLFWNEYFDVLREPKTRGFVHSDDAKANRIAENLRLHGVPVRDYDVDVADFKRYLSRANYPEYWPYYDGGRAPKFIEKALEHYLAARSLDLSNVDVYVDVANDRSPTPEIYRKISGCISYRQDLAFAPGLNGDRIGGDAASIPLPDGFASKLALHCSFEHFEGESDIGFIREASRVLRPGGRLCIVPLYLNETYAIQTNPALMAKGGIEFERDAHLFCAPGWRNRHNRYYDVSHFVDRIVRNLHGLELSLDFVRNQSDVDPACYVKFV